VLVEADLVLRKGAFGWQQDLTRAVVRELVDEHRVEADKTDSATDLAVAPGSHLRSQSMMKLLREQTAGDMAFHSVVAALDHLELARRKSEARPLVACRLVEDKTCCFAS
jgi:hypothetical protein